MSEISASERAVSPLDRAHASRLAGQAVAALQGVYAILAAAPSDVAAGYLAARLLLDAQRTAAVAAGASELLTRFVRRGDLGSACLCAQLIHELGGDRAAALREIAQAFGAGSPRVSDVPLRPPPLPAQVQLTPAAAKLNGAALLDAVEAALTKLVKAPDPAPADAPLPRLPLFGGLAPASLVKLLGVLAPREFRVGQEVVRQGEEGKEAFLLARGALNVLRHAADGGVTTLATLGPGALFGEMALVSNAPRAASVVCLEPAAVLVAPRSQLELLAQREPAIGRELGSFCRQRMLANLVRHSRLLSALEPAGRHELMARFSTQTFQPGELLVRQGEESERLFLIASGGVEVRSADADGDRVVLAQPGPGDVVGEISLVLRRPAVADVVALHTTVALELTRSEFQAAIREHPRLLQELYDVATRRDEETRSVVAREALDVTDNVLL